jgi:uracil-DNA glycosylase
MNKRDEIFNLFNKKLFAEKLDMEDFLKWTPPNKSEARVFACEHKDCCGVDENKHPIWTPAFGDVNTTVMVVGEAPSATGGLSIHFGGLFGDWENNARSPVVPLRDWVKDSDNYGTIPYFTDLAKCGSAKQQDKAELNVRIPKCVKYLLTEEIEIIKPETILCVGNRAYDSVSTLELKGKPKVFKLLHYSNQGTLPLSIEDKKQVIWKWQTHLLSDEDLARIPLSRIASNFWRKSRPA